MTVTRTSLLDRWCKLLRRCQDAGRAPLPDPAPHGEDLLARWDESRRRYHTTAHLVAVLDNVRELAAHATDPDAVLLAAWFHDAVYRPDRPDNEEHSARLAEQVLTEAAVPADRTAEIVRLVRLTETHDPAADDHNGAVLCDADLAVLAGAPQDYATYAAAVRAEYGFLPDKDFHAGRIAVLTRLLTLPRLFRTPHGHDLWEHTARRNMTTELELLMESGGNDV